MNSTIGNDLQGQNWNAETRAQNALAGDIEVMEAAEEAAEQKAKSKEIVWIVGKRQER